MYSILPRISSIVNRVYRNKGIGVLFNVPIDIQFALEKEFRSKDQFFILNGTGPFTSSLFLKRIGLINKVTNPPFTVLPSLIQNKMIMLVGCDVYTLSFSKIIQEMKLHRIPFFILMTNEISLRAFRKLEAYNSVITIEQDYLTI